MKNRYTTPTMVRALVVATLTLFTADAIAITLNLDAAAAGFDVLARRSQIAAHVRVVYQTHRLAEGRIVTDSSCEIIEAAFGRVESHEHLRESGRCSGHTAA